MSGDLAKTRGMPYFLIVKYGLVIIVLSVLLFFIASALNLSEILFQVLLEYPSLHVSELVIVGIFLVLAFAALACRLWRELKQEMEELRRMDTSLDRATTRLSFLNNITSQDILNQLTELSAELEHDPRGELVIAANEHGDAAKLKHWRERLAVKFPGFAHDIAASLDRYEMTPGIRDRLLADIDAAGGRAFAPRAQPQPLQQ